MKLLVTLAFVSLSEQHARLMEPPSRASMWRLGYPTPVDLVRALTCYNE